MNPFLFDLFRVLRNRGVLLIVAATVALTFTSVLVLETIQRPTTPTQAYSEGTTVVFIMGIIFSFFVPLLGIQAAYGTYARDRCTGVLESVLVRPVSRTQVILARYLAVVAASALALGLALVVLDALALTVSGFVLPGGQLAGLFVGLLVETIAFAGIMFILAHVLRSPGAVMGSSVVIFVLVDIVWFFLLVFVGLLLGGISSTSGIQEIVRLEYTDPAGYPFLVMTVAQQGLFGGFINLPLSTLGISTASLVASGILWAVGPFAVAYLLAWKRD